MKKKATNLSLRPKLSDNGRAALSKLVGDRLASERLPELEKLLNDCGAVQRCFDYSREDKSDILYQLDKMSRRFERIQDQLDQFDERVQAGLNVGFNFVVRPELKFGKLQYGRDAVDFAVTVESLQKALMLSKKLWKGEGKRVGDTTYTNALSLLAIGYRKLFPRYKVSAGKGSFFSELAQFWLKTYCNKPLNNPQNHIVKIFDKNGAIKNKASSERMAKFFETKY